MGTPKRNAVVPRCMLAAALVCSAVAWPRLSAAAEQRVALVIGNGDYAAAPLRNPLNDARALAKSLNQLGFEVLLRTNLNQKAMVDAIRDFSAKLKEGDVALFFYSGHGMQVKGRNFLIPIDADIRAEDEVPYAGFDISQVLDKLEAARTRANFVILDACRNNPFIRTFRSGRTGLAQMDAPGGTLIAFSTAPGSEARDGDGDLGTYTKHLIANVATPGLPVEVMFRRVREGVTADTRDRQIPWESSSLKGDFYFTGSAGNPQAVAPVPAPAPGGMQQVDPMAVELAFWNSIGASGNAADFDAYLQQYPDGKFAPLARNRLKSLQQPPPSAASAQTAPSPRAAIDTPAPKATAQSTQVALAPAAAPPASASSGAPGEWDQRRALLEQSRGALTFSKALATWLDINATSDFNLLAAYEADLKRMAWHQAFALGLDHDGRLIWGGGRLHKTSYYASETAMEFCAKSPGDTCKLIWLNGEFREKEFLELAKQLGKQSVENVRLRFLQDLAQRPREVEVGPSIHAAPGTTVSVDPFALGYSSVRAH